MLPSQACYEVVEAGDRFALDIFRRFQFIKTGFQVDNLALDIDWWPGGGWKVLPQSLH
ncbi:hypothetical protein D3C84_1207490 [compost metagenome]